jgi:hypothetical protein
MENTKIFRGCQPVALWQVTSTGVRVLGAPTHPGRPLSGTQAPLRMNCRAAATARHLAPPPVPHHTGRPGIRLMAPAPPAHCRRCAAVQVDGTNGQAPRHAGPIMRAGPEVIREPPHGRNGLGACSVRSRRRRLPGSSRASVARTARSAQDSLGVLTCRWSRATWFAGSRSPHPWHRRTRQAREASRTRAAAQG